MITQEIICDVCEKEILRRNFDTDEELMNNPIDGVYEIKIGNKVVVEDCCHDCAIKVKEYIQKQKEHFQFKN